MTARVNTQARVNRRDLSSLNQAGEKNETYSNVVVNNMIIQTIEAPGMN